MNILFISKKLKNGEKILKIFKENHNVVIGLKINKDILSNKIISKYIKIVLNWQFKLKKVYVILCNNIEIDIIDYINKILDDYCIITEQNNLIKRDYIYIDEYLKKNNIKKKDVKILFIIDEIGRKEKEKIEEFINKFKIVDIYSTNENRILKEYVRYINNTFGSIIQVLDKLDTKYYNVVLDFSKDNINIEHCDSFFLNYNDSDLDTKSNTYLIYKSNEKELKRMIDKLDMKMSDFKYTKLGKLCIQMKWNT